MQLDFQEIAKRAAAASGAKRVILFGSHARGEATLESDVDLMLVLEDGTNLMQAGLAAYRALFPPPCGFDILPISESDFNNGETLISRIVAREGKVLYA
jgi:predicted nucleotidyltransferase